MEFGEGEASPEAEAAYGLEGRIATRREAREREPDRLGKVYGIAEAYRAKYPGGDSPFAILGRILEEAGEIAAEVNHLEATGAKHDKHGDADPRALAGEIEDLLHNVAALASYYRIESLVDDAVDETYARVVSAAATPKRTVRHKVVCYVVRGGELLVFRHVGLDWERVGVQVPAGGIEPGEDPADAAVREAWEETGLEGLRVVSKLGVYDYDVAPYADQLQRCHVFHLEPTGPVPERWASGEALADGGLIPFECFWIPLSDAHVLMAGQGVMIGRLPGVR